MTSSTSKYNQSLQKEQSHLSTARPRHPYAFCQCEGDECVECTLEEREQIGRGIVELAALNKQIHAYRQCSHIRLDSIPDVFSLFSRQHPDRPACRGAC